MTVHGKKTVMIVDDSEVVLEVAREALEAAGYRVLTRNRPGGCMAMMLQESPDLVLVDVSMPEFGGDTLVRCFGTAHPSSRCVMLLHSGMAEEALAQRAVDSGAHGYVKKGSDPRDLVRVVRHWLGHERDLPSAAVTLRRPSGSAHEAVSSGGPESGDALPIVPSHPPQVSGPRRIRIVSVLLVDAEMASLSRYRMELQRDSMVFDFALSAEHALGRLRGPNPPDLVVADTAIGWEDGPTLYQKVAGGGWAERFVLIDPDARDRVNHLGTIVLPKPPAEGVLRQAVDDCLRGLERRLAAYGAKAFGSA